MLFLLNDTVYDIGDIDDTIANKTRFLTPAAPASIKAKSTVELGRALFFHCPAGSRPQPEALEALCAHLAANAHVNAALFVRPEDASDPEDVMLRLADVELPILSHLFGLQGGGRRLDPAIVNSSVWSAAA